MDDLTRWKIAEERSRPPESEKCTDDGDSV